MSYQVWLFQMWLRGLPERIAWRVAFLLPRRVAYIAYIRVHAYATSRPPFDTKHPNECTWHDALEQWEKR